MAGGPACLATLIPTTRRCCHDARPIPGMLSQPAPSPRGVKIGGRAGQSPSSEADRQCAAQQIGLRRRGGRDVSAKCCWLRDQRSRERAKRFGGPQSTTCRSSYDAPHFGFLCILRAVDSGRAANQRINVHDGRGSISGLLRPGVAGKRAKMNNVWRIRGKIRVDPGLLFKRTCTGVVLEAAERGTVVPPHRAAV